MTAASSSGDRKMVTGLFRDRQSFERAYQCVVERGYDIGDISLVMSDDTLSRFTSTWTKCLGEEGRLSLLRLPGSIAADSWFSDAHGPQLDDVPIGQFFGRPDRVEE